MKAEKERIIMGDFQLETIQDMKNSPILQEVRELLGDNWKEVVALERQKAQGKSRRKEQSMGIK